jgi:DNA-binding NarL/FixJ family response regulator
VSEILNMSTKSALVVDAGQELGSMLAGALQPPQWTIQNVADNEAAMKWVEAKKFDLVLTGVTTSGGEDVGLLRKIRRIHPHTRVIVLTSDSTPSDVLDAMREGAFSYFSAPLSIADLEYIVQSAMNGPCWDDGIEVISATPEWIRVRARCDMKTADRLVQFFNEMIDLPDEEKQDVATVFRELLLNAIEHGGRFDPEQYVEISYLRTRRAASCRIKDPGEGFSLNEIPHAAIMNPPDDPIQHQAYRESKNLRPGGFGLLLARNSIDELIYNEKGNEVVLIKYL